jgi:hypothetical protein
MAWDDETAARVRARIVELRRDALGFEEIGRLMWQAGEWPDNLTQPPTKQQVWVQWNRALRAIQAPGLEALRSETREKLAELERRAQEILDRSHVAHSNGQIIKLNGEAVLDDGPKIAAIREIRQIRAQLSKLNGEDAPTQAKVSVDAAIEYTVVGVDPEALK